MNAARRPGRQNWIIAALIVVFVAPVAGSWIIFFFTDIGRDGSMESHGRLIDPPLPLPDIALRGPAGADTEARLHGKWSLLYLVGGDGCDARCTANLERMARLRLALGRHTHRLQRVLVIYGGAGEVLDAQQAADFPGQLLADGALLSAGGTPGLFRLGAGDEPVAAGRLYLVDPLGNLMMSYAPDAAPAGIIDDLKRLMRVSRIG